MTRASLVAALAVLATGCGHPASREECLEIFEKSAEIELRAQNIEDEAEIERRVAEARENRPELLDDCIGKRITDEAMQCVRDAETAEDFDACLD